MKHNLMHISGLIFGLLALAGCAEGGTSVTQGGLRAPLRQFAERHLWSYECDRTYDPTTGQVHDHVVVRDTSQPDPESVQALKEVGLALAAKIPSAPVPVPPMAAAPRAQAPPPPLSLIACLGEHAPTVEMPLPPDPTPPSGQTPQSGDDDHSSLMPLPQSGQSGQSAHEPVPLPHAHPGEPQHPSSEPLG